MSVKERFKALVFAVTIDRWSCWEFPSAFV